MDRQSWVCDRLRDLGYANARHIRLYGKDLRLTSIPVVDGNGYSIEATEHKSATLRRIRIPLMVVRVAEQEATTHEDLLAA